MRAVLLTPALLLLSCGDKDDTSGWALQWYQTCGDPVCQGYTGPFDGVISCEEAGITVGTGCAESAQTCDPVDDCNALLICADEDPTQQPGDCPISRRDAKRNIRYLGPDELAEAGTAALTMPLARWQYRWEDEGAPAHLGFIIDDIPGSPAVRPDGDHVDLYGYTSLAVAAIQAQQARIDAQQAELDRLEAQVAELQGQIDAITATAH